MQAGLHAPPGRWSGNPAVLGRYALRPVALRPRLSNGFALVVPEPDPEKCRHLESDPDSYNDAHHEIAGISMAF